MHSRGQAGRRDKGWPSACLPDPKRCDLSSAQAGESGHRGSRPRTIGPCLYFATALTRCTPWGRPSFFTAGELALKPQHLARAAATGESAHGFEVAGRYCSPNQLFRAQNSQPSKDQAMSFSKRESKLPESVYRVSARVSRVQPVQAGPIRAGPNARHRFQLCKSGCNIAVLCYSHKPVGIPRNA